MINLTQKYLLERIFYNPITGEFIWRSRPVISGYEKIRRIWNTQFAGKKAGCINKTTNTRLQYLEIKLDYKIYKAHRLAFLYMIGKFPPDQVDHKDGNSLNNRWDNLRPATASENCANCNAPSNNTTGFKGVSFVKATGLYHAYITIHRKRTNIGFFKTPKEASEAYKAIALEYFGEFAKW